MIEFHEDVVYALLKYSIHRSSYYNSFACEEIMRVADQLSQKALGNLIRDIYRALNNTNDPIPYSQDNNWRQCIVKLYEKTNLETKIWLFSEKGGNIPDSTTDLPV